MPTKRFPQVVRQGDARLSQHEYTYVAEPLRSAGHKPFNPQMLAKWRRQMGTARTKPGGLLYQPVRNGENDALSITCVLDLLLRIDHDAYTFPAGVTKLLNDQYGHLVQFDPYTVGRIFSGLLAVAPNDENRRPIGTVQWGGARQLVVMWADINAWLWLGQCRELMGQRAELDQREAREGGTVPRDDSTWLVLEQAEWGKAP